VSGLALLLCVRKCFRSKTHEAEADHLMKGDGDGDGDGDGSGSDIQREDDYRKLLSCTSSGLGLSYDQASSVHATWEPARPNPNRSEIQTAEPVSVQKAKTKAKAKAKAKQLCRRVAGNDDALLKEWEAEASHNHKAKHRGASRQVHDDSEDDTEQYVV